MFLYTKSNPSALTVKELRKSTESKVEISDIEEVNILVENEQKISGIKLET